MERQKKQGKLRSDSKTDSGSSKNTYLDSFKILNKIQLFIQLKAH